MEFTLSCVSWTKVSYCNLYRNGQHTITNRGTATYEMAVYAWWNQLVSGLKREKIKGSTKDAAWIIEVESKKKQIRQNEGTHAKLSKYKKTLWCCMRRELHFYGEGTHDEARDPNISVAYCEWGENRIWGEYWFRGEAYNAKRGLWGNWNGMSLLFSAKSNEQTFERETQSTPITGNLEAVEERSNVKAHVK